MSLAVLGKWGWGTLVTDKDSQMEMEKQVDTKTVEERQGQIQ